MTFSEKVFYAAVGIVALVIGAIVIVPRGGGHGVRSLTSRALSDLRSMGVALESYRIDEEALPAGTSRSLRARQSETELPNGSARLMTFPSVLTTPIAHITAFPQDVYLRAENTLLPYAYYTDGKKWIVFSTGPDGDYDITDPAPVLESALQSGWSNNSGDWSFDPTNGMESSGDVWWVKP